MEVMHKVMGGTHNGRGMRMIGSGKDIYSLYRFYSS